MKTKKIPTSAMLFVEQGDKPPIYKELYEIGYEMPPIIVARRGRKYEILDGNKRGRSAIAAGLSVIHATIQGKFTNQ